MQKVWKPLLGELCQLSDRLESTVNCQQLTVSISEEMNANLMEFTEDVRFPHNLGADLSLLSFGQNSRIENVEDVLRNWFDEDEPNDCGWEQLYDLEIVNFVQNGRIQTIDSDEVKITDTYNSDEVIQDKEILNSQAYESINLLQTSAKQKSSRPTFKKIQ